MIQSETDSPRSPQPVHAVRFYEDARSLARIVAGFIGDGLAAADPVIIIATPEHRRAILDAAALTMDVETPMERGDLVLVDARDALATFMVDGMPARQPFEQTIVPVIDRAAGRRRGSVVRVYGEMADLLWKDGREAAAVQLEMLGNQLASTRNVTIFCGYWMGHAYGDGTFQHICREHTHVVSAGGVATKIGSGGVI
jgi:hypothetical protein